MADDSFVVNFRNQALKLETTTDINELFEGIDLVNVSEVILCPISKLLNFPTYSRSIDEIPPALTIICSALLECKQLSEVDLSDNAFGQRSVDPVVPLLSGSLSLKVVKLANVGLNWQGGQILAEALLASAEKSKKLKQPSNLISLGISKNLLRDGSASSWGEVIAAHSNLQRLEMLRTDLREDGIMAIASALAKCRDLRHLNLSDNVIANYGSKAGKRGWKVVADVIRGAKDLQYLDLSSCLLEEDGCEEIIAALDAQTYPKLKRLNLNGNSFSEAHYAALKDAITHKLSALKVLNLVDNEDLEDSDTVDSIKELLEGRGGRLILEDEDETEEEEEEGFVEEGGGSKLSAAKTEDSGIDQLADSMVTSLTIEESKS
ncbi:Leucine-rich repeat domain superfamily protein [Abortiporus biennis]